MKIIIQIFVLILVLPFVSLGQEMKLEYHSKKVSKEINKMVNKIAKYNKIDSRAIGFGGVRTVQYDRFIKLTEKASLTELIALTNHPNAVVRGYSFWGLAKRQYDDLEVIFEKHANDNELVFFMEGCFLGEFPVISFMSQVVTRNRIDIDCKKISNKTINRVTSKRKMLQKKN